MEGVEGVRGERSPLGRRRTPSPSPPPLHSPDSSLCSVDSSVSGVLGSPSLPFPSLSLSTSSLCSSITAAWEATRSESSTIILSRFREWRWVEPPEARLGGGGEEEGEREGEEEKEEEEEEGERERSFRVPE